MICFFFPFDFSLREQKHETAAVYFSWLFDPVTHLYFGYVRFKHHNLFAASEMLREMLQLMSETQALYCAENNLSQKIIYSYIY